jgi:inner membrane transporter RhtA
MTSLTTAGGRAGGLPWLPIVTLITAMLSFQYGASMAKGLFPRIGPEGATALRIGLAAILLAPIMRPWRLKLSRRSWPMLVGYGVSLGCMNLLFYMALRTVPLGMTVALEFTGPLAVALISSRRWRDLGCAGLAAAGLALLTPVGRTTAVLDPKGALFALGAGACWALYILFGQRTGREHGPATVALGMIVAACIAVPVGVAHAGWALLSPALLPAALAVAVFSSALPYTLEMITLTRLPAQTYGVLTSMEPASAALIGLALLHEQLSPRQLLAVVLIMLASVWAALSSRQALVPPE